MFEDIIVKKDQSKLGVVNFWHDFKTDHLADDIGNIVESVINAILHVDFEGFEHNNRKAVLRSYSSNSGRVDLRFDLYDMTDECQKEACLISERIRDTEENQNG